MAGEDRSRASGPGLSSTGSSAMTRTARGRLDQPKDLRPRLLPEYDPEAFGRFSSGSPASWAPGGSSSG